MLKQKVMDDLDALLADLQSTTSHISNYQSGAGGPRTPSPVDNDSVLSGGIGHPPAASSTPIHGNLYAQVQPSRAHHQHSSSVVVNSVHGVTSNGKGSQGSSRESTPPPVPPHPSKEALEHLGGSINEPLYETQVIKQQQQQQQQQQQKSFNNNTTNHHVAQVTAAVGRQYVSTDGAPQPHQGIPITPGMALPQPRSPSTNSMQSGPKSPPPVAPKPTNSSSLSANLSELDILLQDLSSAQFLEEVDRKNAANHPSGSVSQPGTMGSSPRPPADRSVDSLLFELEKSMSSQQKHGLQTNGYGNYIQESHYEQIRPASAANRSAPSTLSSGATMPANMQTPGQRAAAASSATRELEELMNSLSEFRVTDPPSQTPEVPYAQPNKQKLSPVIPYPPQPGQDVTDSTATAVHTTSKGIPVAQHAASTPPSMDTPLETMLGDLNSDMTRQGIMTIPKGHCAACMKPIVGQVITALGKIWHPEHFNCAKCKQELGTQNFYEREGLPYCETDYHQLFSPKCAKCKGPILDKCVTALDQTWHPEHFVCYTCGRPFSEEGFHEKDGKAFCRDDYFDNFSPKCGGCGRAIMDNYISALNRQWHPECFVCMECLMPFGTGSFYDHEGLPYCETHYHARRGSLCAGCHKPITGRCITAMYKKFHPEHFVCAFCLKQLNKGTFKEQNDKPYCHPCFVKLFG